MLFNSLPFVALVLITFALYYLPFMRRWQVQVLVAASFVFYAYGNPALLLLLLASIAINVVTSYQIVTDRPSRQRLWAVLGVGLNLALLLFFKYSPLFARSFLGGASTSLGHFLTMIPLPIGISFFTFQGISLVVEVFRNQRQSAADPAHPAPQLVAGDFLQHLRHTMLFKSFFPNLVAGPIVKAHEFYPQIKPKSLGDIQWERAFRSLVIGYILKMVVADNLKDSTFWIAFPYFLNKSSLTLTTLLFGFSMQIFADFAGYSLIAVGLGLLFGYALPRNFDFPYVARSFSEFWRRWHISLSTWLKEYLYIPLGGNRHGGIRTYANLFAVMFLGGLWHGAAWSYAIWGSFHGMALAAERLTKNWIRLPKHRVVEILQALLVFAFVTLAWLLFKLPKIGEAVDYVRAMLHNHRGEDFGLIASVLAFSAPVMAYYAWHGLKHRWGRAQRFEFLLLGALLAGIALNSGSAQKFIYFQF